MATSLTNKIPQQAVSLGGLKARVVDLSLALNDYVTGGIAITAASVSLAEIYGVTVLGQDGTTVGYLAFWDQVAGKLRLHQDATPAAAAAFPEVGNGASTAVTFRLLVIGV